jgi:predicted transcriptional regulator
MVVRNRGERLCGVYICQIEQKNIGKFKLVAVFRLKLKLIKEKEKEKRNGSIG